MSNNIATAIEDPYGFGFEGRVAVDRHSSKRRKHVATVIRQFSTHSLLAPVAVQYEYLLCYGYYTAEEMKDHPGRRKQVQSKAELQNMELAQELRDTKQQEYLGSLHKDQWERHERRVTRWGQKRLELEQQQSHNSQHEDLISHHDDAASEHDDTASQHDDAASQQDDGASQQDEQMNDDDDEPADEDLPGDRAQVSGWDTTDPSIISSTIQDVYGRRHPYQRRRGIYGGGRGRGSNRIHFAMPEYEGSSRTGDVYMSGALQGGYGRREGLARAEADNGWVQLDV